VTPDPVAEVVAAILRDGERVLLCHRLPSRRWFPDVWDLPGGHVEPGEQATAALVRELREELAVVIAEPGPVPAAVIELTGCRMQVWVIDAWDGVVTNVAPDEHDDLAWVDAAGLAHLDGAGGLAHPDYRSLLLGVLTGPGAGTL
jgi:8-oxo-dGTP pyrophosphatase MutT (NUDIX family)